MTFEVRDLMMDVFPAQESLATITGVTNPANFGVSADCKALCAEITMVPPKPQPKPKPKPKPECGPHTGWWPPRDASPRAERPNLRPEEESCELADLAILRELLQQALRS